MPVRIGICDDRVEDIRVLTEALYAYDPSFQVSTYADGESLLEACCYDNMPFDILFLDIYMPGLNGIETASRLRGCKIEMKIIFISSSSEHYPEAYDLFAFNYMVKPVDREKLNRVLDQALVDIGCKRSQQISFTHKSTTYRIYCKDILYLESRDKTIHFHMGYSKTLQCQGKLDDILDQLPAWSFIRCHQSFAVNVSHVTEIGDGHFRIDQAVISISKKYRKAAKDNYFAYLFGHLRGGLR